MDREELKSLLREIGLSSGNYEEFKDSGDNIQFCCPFHGETRPSCGINVYDLVGYCFACGESFHLSKLVAHCKGYVLPRGEYDYPRADLFLEEKFNLERREIHMKEGTILRLGEDQEEPWSRHEGDFLDLAVFKSGKVTHQYFFDRGFTQETVEKFSIGWDSKRLRVTIPVFWEDGVYCGTIGRAVLPMKNLGQRNPKFFKVYTPGNDVKYHIYDKFPVGETLFPLNHFRAVEGIAVIVEGQFDAMWAHQQGFPNFLASLGSKFAYNKRDKESKQIEKLIDLGVEAVVLMRDNDEAGKKGMEKDSKILKQYGLTVYEVEYPEGKNDTQELTREQIQTMLDNKRLYGLEKIKRI